MYLIYSPTSLALDTLLTVSLNLNIYTSVYSRISEFGGEACGELMIKKTRNYYTSLINYILFFKKQLHESIRAEQNA